MNTKWQFLIGEDMNSELPLNFFIEAYVMAISTSTVMFMLFI